MMIPGETITTFTTKTGQKAVIRYAQVSDAEDLMNFINPFSKEDQFTRFSGEQLSLEEETAYLESEVAAMEAGNNVKLFCYVDSMLAGVCDVHRDTLLLTRKLHTGILGLIIAKEFRSQGIGETLFRTTISEAERKLENLKLLKLDCFATNTPALSLYKKVGFKQVGEIPRALLHKGEYVNEVIMVKEIA